MNERRIGIGITVLLALSACNAIVGVEEVQLTGGTGASGGSGGSGGAGGGGPCSIDSDCGVSDECKIYTCGKDGTCSSMDSIVGTVCGANHTSVCNGLGECLNGIGQPCDPIGKNQCASGFCVDGVCCVSGCNQECFVCNNADSLGMCTPSLAGTVDGQCVGPSQACDGQGTCKKEFREPCAQDADCLSGVCADGLCAGQSCGAAQNCGPGGNESCCAAPLVPAGTVWRGTNSTYAAMLSDFRLNRFEVTVGRFRKFVEAYGLNTKPTKNAGGNPRFADSGWFDGWNTSQLPQNAGDLQAALMGDPNSVATWTATPGANENLPINHVSWYEAFAFCVWDGGRLPTEAELDYARNAGAESRVYPWSFPPNSTILTSLQASYECIGANDPKMCTLSDILKVGLTSPSGDGKWHHADLVGNMREWSLDEFGPLLAACTDCVRLPYSSTRVTHGGGWRNLATELDSTQRFGNSASTRTDDLGFRCVYDVNTSCVNTIVDGSEACQDNMNDPSCKHCDKVAKVVAGETHTCVVTVRGKLKCWGDNDHGQLGQDNTIPIKDPANWPVVQLPDVADVALSQDRTCALLRDTNEVKCFGADQINGASGLLGTFNPIGADQGAAPNQMQALASVNLDKPVASVVSGTMHSCALLQDGSVRCWGGNATGQLGINGTTEFQGPPPMDVFNIAKTSVKVQSIAASNRSTCAILMDDRVACWGLDKWTGAGPTDYFGVLGLNNATNPARGDDADEMTAKLMATVLPTEAIPPAILSGAANGYCVYSASMLLPSVRCWGANEYGQLGRESNVPWGSGEFGNDMQFLPSISLGAAFVPARIVAGYTHTCVFGKDGALKCFGDNRSGALGLGLAPPNNMSGDFGIGDAPSEMGDGLKQVDLGKDAVEQLSLGYLTTCALLTNGRVKCWGRNDMGQTGVLPGDPAIGDDILPDLTMAPQHVSGIPYVDPL